MIFSNFKKLIKSLSTKSTFDFSANKLHKIIFSLDKKKIIPLISEIGTIPEDIEIDSSEEKLYAKVSDILFAKTLEELGLITKVFKERSGTADIFAKSKLHRYTLVGDAKIFRLSRTAKNQKDFKVESMTKWSQESDFSVLCCPYYQYPQNKSQIYRQALEGNIALFSWEYLYILLDKDVKETSEFSLASCWNQSAFIAKTTSVAQGCVNFLNKQNKFLKKLLSLNDKSFESYFNEFEKQLCLRGKKEISYWENEITRIKSLSKTEAIEELLKALKLNNKIKTIQKFIEQVTKQNDRFK
ncbi:MAG: HindIII family type II restriction endonuclease [Elusimicrobiota bacterium]|jgi:type II restriction enzyme|nr:HindIII family type II restriction endonuclease [Elusimicrobiota bacterium]